GRERVGVGGGRGGGGGACPPCRPRGPWRRRKPRRSPSPRGGPGRPKNRPGAGGICRPRMKPPAPPRQNTASTNSENQILARLSGTSLSTRGHRRFEERVRGDVALPVRRGRGGAALRARRFGRCRRGRGIRGARSRR